MRTFKCSQWNNKFLCGLALALALNACSSTSTKPVAIEDKSPTQATKPADVAPAAGVDTSVIKEVALDQGASNSGSNSLKDPNNILSKRKVYFNFDSDEVKAEFRPLLEAHAKYLLANASAKVTLQGNTDERGTREYNLSLGQRRSVAVKKTLNLLGVQDAQIETVSFGEEKSAPNCAEDPCAKENRRVDIVYENE